MTDKEIHAQFMAHVLGASIGRDGVFQWSKDNLVQEAMIYADLALEAFKKRWPGFDCKDCGTQGSLCGNCQK